MSVIASTPVEILPFKMNALDYLLLTSMIMIQLVRSVLFSAMLYVAAENTRAINL